MVQIPRTWHCTAKRPTCMSINTAFPSCLKTCFLVRIQWWNELFTLRISSFSHSSNSYLQIYCALPCLFVSFPWVSPLQCVHNTITQKNPDYFMKWCDKHIHTKKICDGCGNHAAPQVAPSYLHISEAQKHSVWGISATAPVDVRPFSKLTNESREV